MNETSEKRVSQEAARFPSVFCLRGYPGKQFKISREDSYISEGRVVLYVHVLNVNGWESFGKGTAAELLAQVLPVAGATGDGAMNERAVSEARRQLEVFEASVIEDAATRARHLIRFGPPPPAVEAQRVTLETNRRAFLALAVRNAELASQVTR